MANVKSRESASKTATNGKGSGKVGRPKKSVLDINNKKHTPVQVMKIPRIDKSNEKLHSSRKDRGLLSNLIDKILLNNAKLRKYIQLPNSNIKKISNGPIVNKNKHNLKLYDNILKTELMIDDSNKIQREKIIEEVEKTITKEKDTNSGKIRKYADKVKKNKTVRKIKYTQRKSVRSESKIGTKLEKKNQLHANEQKIQSSVEKNINSENHSEKSILTNTGRRIKANTLSKVGIHSERKKGSTIETNTHKKIQDKSNNLNNNDLALTNQNTDDNNKKDCSDLLQGSSSGLTKSKHIKNNDKDHKKPSDSKRNSKLNKIKKPIDKTHIFQCDLCQKQFHSKCSLRRHMYIHLEHKNNYKCNQCNKTFRKQLYLSAHIRRQHPNWEEHYMCNMCYMPFQLKENLTVHLATHNRSETMFKCVYCMEKFPTQQELINHEKQHLVSGRYQCIICEMDFDCRNRLTTHFKTHYKVKDFICQHCGKEFLRLNSMRRHVSICHSGIRIQCPICNKFLKGHLTEHMRTHEKKRPHECPDCGQRFTQSTQLNVHRRSHTGARPYPCRICNRPFSHSNALMLHIRRHTGEKPFVCAMCPISFSQLPHMKAHMRNIHGKINPYKCQKCKQFFKLKVELENHAKCCTVGDQVLSLEEKNQASIKEAEVESTMSLSRMRFLLALLLTKIATKEKLKYLGFNKRLIDDILVESLEGMDHQPCKDNSLAPLKRLRRNIELLLDGTVPKDQMDKFKKENKSTEELLELLTNEKKSK